MTGPFSSSNPVLSTEPPPSVHKLSTSTHSKLRSSALLPTLPHILSELLHNSLDAGAGKIEVWLDASKEGQSIRVEDDGCGISGSDLGQVGGRWRSSKVGSGVGWNGVVAAYGFRGEGEHRSSQDDPLRDARASVSQLPATSLRRPHSLRLSLLPSCPP